MDQAFTVFGCIAALMALAIVVAAIAGAREGDRAREESASEDWS